MEQAAGQKPVNVACLSVVIGPARIAILLAALATGMAGRADARSTPDSVAPAPDPHPEVEPGQPAVETLPPIRFTADEAQAARALCVTRLATENVAAELLAPIEGEDGCGLAAPLMLSLIGAATVEIRPPATVGCTLAATLARWTDTVLQPLALASFGEKVATITNVSSYVCRRRNRRPGARISEHARGNALDIAAFTLQSGRIIAILGNWSSGTDNGEFLRKLHERSCGPFGTVLGPDANDAHKGHFHLDGTARKSAFCE